MGLLENKFLDTLKDEMRIVRFQRYTNFHVHLVLYMCTDALTSIEITLLKQISKYAVVFPVIAKSDIRTIKELGNLNYILTKQLQDADIVPLDFLSQDTVSEYGLETCDNNKNNDDDDDINETDIMDYYFPYTIFCGEDGDSPGENKTKRQFSWGVADAANPKHCEYSILIFQIFQEWRKEIVSWNSELYEAWRAERLSKTTSCNVYR